MSILVIAEHDNSNLKGSTLNTVTAATSLTGEVNLLVIGSNVDNVVEESKLLDGVNKIIKCDADIYANAIAEDLSNIIESLSNGYTHILAPATTFGKNLMPRIAAKLDTQQISDIISIESDDTFKRPIYAGSCIATVKSNDTVKVITVRSTAFDPVTQNNSGVEVETIDGKPSAGISKFVSEELAQSFVLILQIQTY